MKGIKLKGLCVIFFIMFCSILTSCEMSENILQSSSEVDFSAPQKVQISFNDRIYDTTIMHKDSETAINFINKNDLLNGACVRLDGQKYKIFYNEMIFQGDTSALSSSSLPCVIYAFFSSFDNVVVLDSHDKEKECYYVKKIVGEYFVVLEAYEKDDKTLIFSMEIK